MSVITPQGGAVPTGDAASFYSAPGFDVAISLRIVNTTNAPISYSHGLFNIGGLNAARSSGIVVGANGYLDVEVGLKLKQSFEVLVHSASAPGLQWSVTGVQDDGT